MLVISAVTHTVWEVTSLIGCVSNLYPDSGHAKACFNRIVLLQHMITCDRTAATAGLFIVPASKTNHKNPTVAEHIFFILMQHGFKMHIKIRMADSYQLCIYSCFLLNTCSH